MAQPGLQIKGLYVDGFDKIIGNKVLEDSLLQFAQDNQFNYLTLYRLHVVNEKYNITNYKGAKVLASFIRKAKVDYGIKQIGGAGENFMFFRDVLDSYNQQHPDTLQKIDVYNLEFEFWVQNTVGSYYCSQYLIPEGYSCDAAGAFAFYIKTLGSIDSLAHLSGVLSETYIGWANMSQSRQVGNTCDRILVLDYVQNDKSLFPYAQKRLHYFRYCNKKVSILPIFSAEGGVNSCGTTEFMGSWLESNPEDLAFTTFTDDYNASPGGQWKNNIEIAGYQWFDYSCLKTNQNVNLKILTDQVDFKDEKALQIVNLEGNQLGLQFAKKISGNALITIMDIQGNLLFSQPVSLEKGFQIVQLPENKLAAGMYIFNCYLPDGSFFSTKWIR